MSDKPNSKKEQGTYASSKSLGERGLGSAYANAVGGLMNQVDGVKGSKNGFLGVAHKTIDPRQFSHSLNKDKKGDK